MYLYDMYKYMYYTSCPQGYVGEIKKFLPFPSYSHLTCIWLHVCTRTFEHAYNVHIDLRIGPTLDVLSHRLNFGQAFAKLLGVSASSLCGEEWP